MLGRYNLMVATLCVACGSTPPTSQCRVPARPPPPRAHHFYDPASNPVEKVELAWPTLEAFFGDALPRRVTVDYELSGQSHFDPRTNTIHLVVSSYNGEPELAVLAHETSHLALARLTAGASTEERFRFLDEGLATVMQYEVQGLAAQRRGMFRTHAGAHLHAGRATLTAMQQWSTYFGDPAVKADFTAYEDGAAFVFFLSDTYGQATFKSLLVDIGKTRALASSVSTVLGQSIGETEQLWETYLLTAAAARAAPAGMVTPR